MWIRLPEEYREQRVEIAHRSMDRLLKMELVNGSKLAVIGIWTTDQIAAYLNASKMVCIEGEWRPLSTQRNNLFYWDDGVSHVLPACLASYASSN